MKDLERKYMDREKELGIQRRKKIKQQILKKKYERRKDRREREKKKQRGEREIRK
jgi:hypothetical protein